MTSRSPWIAGATLTALALGAAMIFAHRSQSQIVNAGLWFDDGACVLSPNSTERLGGSLTDAEQNALQRLARVELERAFAGLRITFGDERDAFWRVAVRRTFLSRGPRPRSGQSRLMGFLGGVGDVDCEVVASEAITYAPPGASRAMIVNGIGRGVGRVAAHEFAHQILSGMNHDETDVDSYEYPSPDRYSQYYGELHWSIARAALEQKLGARHE